MRCALGWQPRGALAWSRLARPRAAGLGPQWQAGSTAGVAGKTVAVSRQVGERISGRALARDVIRPVTRRLLRCPPLAESGTAPGR